MTHNHEKPSLKPLQPREHLTSQEIVSSPFLPVMVIAEGGSIKPHLEYVDENGQKQQLHLFPLVPFIQNWQEQPDVVMKENQDTSPQLTDIEQRQLAALIAQPSLLWEKNPTNKVVGAYLAYLNSQEPVTPTEKKLIRPVVGTLVIKVNVPHNGSSLPRTYEAKYNHVENRIDFRWMAKPSVEFLNAPKLHQVINGYQSTHRDVTDFLKEHGFSNQFVQYYR